MQFLLEQQNNLCCSKMIETIITSCITSSKKMKSSNKSPLIQKEILEMMSRCLGVIGEENFEHEI